MILFIGIVCLAVACAVLRPDTLPGGALHEALIAGPARLLSGKGFTQVVAGFLVVVFVLSVMTAPELLAVLAISDLTVYFEVVALAMLLGAGTRLKAALAVATLPAKSIARRLHGALAALSVRRPPRGERRMTRRPRKGPPPAKEPGPGWAPAFA